MYFQQILLLQRLHQPQKCFAFDPVDGEKEKEEKLCEMRIVIKVGVLLPDSELKQNTIRKWFDRTDVARTRMKRNELTNGFCTSNKSDKLSLDEIK